VDLERRSAKSIRIVGLKGKDHSVEGLTMGASFRGRHPKRAIMDDPVTEEDVSQATRDHAQRKYNELLKLTPNVALIGQPVHKHDLYQILRTQVRVMEVPHGSIPELDADLEAQRLAGVSEESIQASYFLKIVSETGFPLEDVQFIDDFPMQGDAVAFMDPSFEGGDYTALTIIKMHFGGIAVKGRVWKRAWHNCIDELADELIRCGVRKFCFETNCLGEQPIILLRDFLDGIGVVGKYSTGFKHSRILALGTFVRQIFIAKTSDKTYIRQILEYEHGCEFDDAPDSLASCCEWIGLIKGKK
jgi:hypothetical protein